MRPLVPLAILLLMGCHRQALQSSRVVQVDGTNQLILYECVRPWLLRNGEDHEFHSLVWRVRAGTSWMDKVVITREAFQAGTPRERWVSDIQGLDTRAGVAVIKVAEDSLPIGNGNMITINTVYSWREWKLLTNGEVRTVCVCKEPFEKY